MKGSDNPWKKKNNYLATPFVGIDIASRIHVISALDFNQDFFIKMKPVQNTQEERFFLKAWLSMFWKKTISLDTLSSQWNLPDSMVSIWLIVFLPVIYLLHFQSLFIASILKKWRIIKNPSTTLERTMALILLSLPILPVSGVSVLNLSVVPNTLLYKGLPDTVCTSLNALPEKKLYVK